MHTIRTVKYFIFIIIQYKYVNNSINSRARFVVFVSIAAAHSNVIYDDNTAWLPNIYI